MANPAFYRALGEDQDFFKHFIGHLIEEHGIDLTLSIIDRCTIGCLHCSTNAIPKGDCLPFERFSSIDGRYFAKSKGISLGSQGEPLEYRDKGKTIVDTIQVLADRGVEQFHFLTAGFTPDQQAKIRLIEQMVAMCSDTLRFSIGMSFHLYWPVADEEVYAYAKKRMMCTLGMVAVAADHVDVQMRWDIESQYRNLFYVEKLWQEVANELEIQKNDKGAYAWKVGDRDIRISLTGTFTQSYGRWSEVLQQRSVLMLSDADRQALREHFGVSEDLPSHRNRWKWANYFRHMYARVNGDLDIEYSVEAQGDPRTIANLYEQPYEEVVERWLSYLWEHYYHPHSKTLAEAFPENRILIES